MVMDTQEDLDHQSDNRPCDGEETRNVPATSTDIKAVSDSEELSQPYEKKYLSLLKKCQSIQQGNDRLVNRIHRVKRLLKQLRKEKRFLTMRLDHYGDGYKKVPIANSDIQFSKESSSPESVSTKRSHPTVSQTKPSSQSSKSHQSGLGSSSKKKSGTNSKHPRSGSLTKHSEKEEKCNATIVKWPENPFFLFCQEQRSKILDSKQLESKGDISHEELTRMLAKNWSNLPIQEKRVYFDTYERQKSQYEQELKSLNATGSISFNSDIEIKEEISDSGS